MRSFKERELEKVTIRLYRGDFEKLQWFYRDGNRIIRDLVSRHLKRIEEIRTEKRSKG